MFKELLGSSAAQLAARWSLVLATALVILLVGIWLSRWIASLVRKAMMRRANDVALAGFVANTVFFLLCAVAIVGALDRIGVPTASLVAALGAAGLAIGLALRDSLGNLAAGVLLVVSRPFRAGDFVEVAGRQGSVDRIDLMHTVLSLPDNSVVSVPNGIIMNAPIVNFTARPVRRLELVFQVSLEDDPQRAVQMIGDALREHARVVAEPAPQVALQRLSEGGFEIVARPWVRSYEVAAAQTELLALVGQLLTSNGFHAPQRVMRLVPLPGGEGKIQASVGRREEMK